MAVIRVSSQKPRLQPRRRRVAHGPRVPAPTRPFPPTHLIPLPGRFPEDVIVGRDGGVDGGDIVQIDPATERCSVVATTGGRPLGLAAAPDGLLVCAAHRGLLHVDPVTGTVNELATAVAGEPLQFCSNAAIAPDGSVWFTESSTRIPFEHYPAAFLEHNPSGRLLRWDPTTGEVDVALENLDFPNGLTVAPDGQSLILVETAGYRISRVELDAAGQIGAVHQPARFPRQPVRIPRRPRLVGVHQSPQHCRRRRRADAGLAAHRNLELDARVAAPPTPHDRVASLDHQ